MQVMQQWNYGTNGERSSRPTGYQFSQSITVKLSAQPPSANVTSELISRVLDAAVTAGGNNLTVDSVRRALVGRLGPLTMQPQVAAAGDASPVFSLCQLMPAFPHQLNPGTAPTSASHTRHR